MYTKENSKTLMVSTAVLAWPMTLGEYNAYRGWEIPTVENPDDAGLLLEQINGREPNHPNHQSPITWSNTNAFTTAYAALDAANMTWQDRVELDSAELDSKIAALHEFLARVPEGFSPAHLSLLKQQATTMALYNSILHQRLALHAHEGKRLPPVREGANTHGIGPDTDGGPNPDYVDPEGLAAAVDNRDE